MKLRTRLFLSVGLVFCIVFILSLIFEIYLTDKKIDTAEKKLREELIEKKGQGSLTLDEQLNFNKKATEDLVHALSLNLRVAAIISLILVLYILNFLAKKITKPISLLAKATNNVAAGRLQDIELPQLAKDHNDEIAMLCNSFEQMVKGLQEKEKVKGVLNKLVSPEIASEVLKGKIHLGGEEKKVTILFADIRDFTHLSSTMQPHEVVEMLNTCMTKVSHVIDEFGGVIDKYVGDEVMALYGVPIDKEDSALKAIFTGLKMVDVLKKWNEERQKKGLPKIEMGIGIHTGIVVVGNMGAENRLNYTVIGSNVNLAARLCGKASKMQILISKETLDESQAKEQLIVEPLSPMSLKGFDEKIEVYAIRGRK
ncbi:MAG: HAMP domain-containing protein [Chlamydiae bacterium]|nr:HAMP domain-containing protein [Chlamydiota bacterium]